LGKLLNEFGMVFQKWTLSKTSMEIALISIMELAKSFISLIWTLMGKLVLISRLKSWQKLKTKLTISINELTKTQINGIKMLILNFVEV
jgi:hypothetical protein